MDVFTMVVTACIAGETPCTQARVSEMGFTSLEICESSSDKIIDAMTKDFARDPRLKGKQVTFEVTCMDRTQLRAKLGVSSVDM